MKIFISYRRNDLLGHAAGLVGRLRDKLAQEYGSENVFLDIDTIPPGVDFAEHIGNAVAKTNVLLAVIGPQWAEIFDEKAEQANSDYVKTEIEAALTRDIPVVPLLVGGATIPGAELLPESLAKLRKRNAYTLDSGKDFHSHVERLIDEMDCHYGRSPGRPAPSPQTGFRSKKKAFPCLLIVGATIALLGSLLGVFQPWNSDTKFAELGKTPKVPEKIPRKTGDNVSGGKDDASHREQTIQQNSEPNPVRADSRASSPLKKESQLEHQEPFINTLGMEFVPVPSLKGILVSRWETRVKDYAAYAAENQGFVNMEWKDAESEGQKQESDHPVVNLDWQDAKGFCAWLSEKEGKTYRLPTDHEWSVAVGIGDREDPSVSPKSKSTINDVYPWGTEYPPPRGAGNYEEDGIEEYADPHPFTAPVGSYNPNPHGLYDLGGNVWEWCADSLSPSSQILRGGSWADYGQKYLRSSERSSYQTGWRYNYHGFRCVLEVGGAL